MWNWAAKIVLVAATAACGIVATLAFRAPETALVTLDLPADTVTARHEVRATYGGLQLAFALVFLAGVVVSHTRRNSLKLLAIVTGGLLFGRAVAVVDEGLPDRIVLWLTAAEVAMFLPATALLATRSSETTE